MEKPKKYQPVDEQLNYLDCINYIEKKYDIQTRGYADYEAKKVTSKPLGRRARKKKRKEDLSASSESTHRAIPYEDFWHWVLDESHNEISNPCSIWLATHPEAIAEEYPDAPKFVITILGYLHAEFGDADTREIQFWVSW